MAGSKLASAHDQRALGRGESIHLWPCWLKNACHTRGEKEEACDLTCRYSPAFFYPPAKRRRWEYSPLVLCSTRARFGELSSKFEGRGSSELCSTVSPSTHSVCLNIVQFGENINKCCTIAARQAAEGDMPKRLKLTKIQKYEERSSSITAGGSTRSFSGSPHSRSNDVITVQRQPEVFGGILSSRIANWCACVVHPWVLSTISRGYRLQFTMKPPRFNGVIVSVAEGESARVLTAEIESLLNKRAIRVVPEKESRQGFYSRYFVITKKGSAALHPILDLCVLNKHLRKYSFRM